ncbi:TldD/PmbA family protein [candidate division TA06 bacterium]|nr:TldD/PmbA family protein [candidate division TA06 bacterium]
MEKLLEMAGRAADQAEVFSAEQSSSSATFQDAKLYDIRTNFLSGVSLRIIKDGRLGFAYTRNLKDRQGLLDNALDSLRGGVEAHYDLPDTRVGKSLATYDPAASRLSSSDLTDEAKRICEILKAASAGEIMAGAYVSVDSLRVLNSRGADLSQRNSLAGSYSSIIFPGSGSGIGREVRSRSMAKMPDNLISEMTDLFKQGQKTVQPKGGRMKVLFMPESMITLLWRIVSGLSGRSVYEKISPNAARLGQRIFSPKLTIYDDPLNDACPGARAWDDEGVPCKKLSLIEQGVLKGFFYDLKYAEKMSAASTGHGYRGDIWSGDPVTVKPGPFLGHLFMEPGTASLAKLISQMDRGIIIEGVMGAHSGNIPNGDYSIGIGPGLYVENGQIVGRVKDAMAAGNIYETLSNVVEVGDTLYPSFEGARVPPLLCEGVSVTTKT